MFTAFFPHQNHLLKSLNECEFDRLSPNLELVRMALGQTLVESGVKPNYVYFPASGIISLLNVMENGASAEIAVVGNEGILGITVFMGGGSTPTRAVVQSAGLSYRIKANILLTEFNLAGPLQHLLLRYTQALMIQMAQTAACNRHHSIDQQLCRWLLLSFDRLNGDTLYMTQELIANMLGVRREGVTEAACKLQSSGLIKYSRGKITLTDRPNLEKRCCECYSVVKLEFNKLVN